MFNEVNIVSSVAVIVWVLSMVPSVDGILTLENSHNVESTIESIGFLDTIEKQ